MGIVPLSSAFFHYQREYFCGGWVSHMKNVKSRVQTEEDVGTLQSDIEDIGAYCL